MLDVEAVVLGEAFKFKVELAVAVAVEVELELEFRAVEICSAGMERGTSVANSFFFCDLLCFWWVLLSDLRFISDMVIDDRRAASVQVSEE